VQQQLHPNNYQDEGDAMAFPKFIDIDGKRYLWRDVLQLRREQLKAFARAEQPPLFALRLDQRPEHQRTAAGRYREPSLFAWL
jgi:hypothetical protein